MADDNDSRSVSHCLEAAAVGSSLHSRSNIPASNKEEASFVFQHDSSLVEKPGFFLLSSPSVAFSVVLHELQGIANKSTWEKSQCEFVIYQNPHFFCISPAPQETGVLERDQVECNLIFQPLYFKPKRVP